MWIQKIGFQLAYVISMVLEGTEVKERVKKLKAVKSLGKNKVCRRE